MGRSPVGVASLAVALSMMARCCWVLRDRASMTFHRRRRAHVVVGPLAGAGCVVSWSEQTAVPPPLAVAPPPTLGWCTRRWSIGWTSRPLGRRDRRGVLGRGSGWRGRGGPRLAGQQPGEARSQTIKATPPANRPPLSSIGTAHHWLIATSLRVPQTTGHAPRVQAVSSSPPPAPLPLWVLRAVGSSRRQSSPRSARRSGVRLHRAPHTAARRSSRRQPPPSTAGPVLPGRSEPR
jgi:hypothetical protein